MIRFAITVFFGFGLGLASAGTPTFILTPQSTVAGRNGIVHIRGIYDPDGEGSLFPQYLSNIDWKSSKRPILSSLGNGEFKALRAGVATVTANYNGLTAKATVTVAGQIQAGTLSHGSLIRSFQIYIPDSYVPKNQTPLVLVFHGGGGSGTQVMNQSQIIKVAAKYGFIVAFPEGKAKRELLTLSSWNAGECCGPALTRGHDDVGFVRALVKQLKNTYSINSQKIFATGISNGGMLSHRLACEASDIIAAIAPISGTIATKTCSPARKVPILMFHGTTDRNAPFEGGTGDGISDYYKTSVVDTFKGWAIRNDATEQEQNFYSKGIATCRGSTDGLVNLCLLDPPKPLYDPATGIIHDGGGHAWPGGIRGESRANADVPTPDIDASEVAWRFFESGLRL